MSDEELIATLDDWLSNSVCKNTRKKRLVRELIKRYSDKKLENFRKLLINDLPEGMKVLIMSEKDFCRLYKSDYISKDKVKKELLEPINKERQETYKEFMKKGKNDYHGVEGSVLQELNWIVGTIEELLGE